MAPEDHEEGTKKRARKVSIRMLEPLLLVSILKLTPLPSCHAAHPQVTIKSKGN